MSIQVQHRRGTAAENAAFTGSEGEFVYITDTKQIAAHDGITAGGTILPTQAEITQVIDLITGTPAEGDILYRASTTWSRLAKGTAGQLLQMNSGATAPEWGATNRILGRAYAENKSTDVTNIRLPNNDTIPQRTEGKQAVTLTYSRQSATSKLIVNYGGTISAASAAAGAFTLFNGGTSAVDIVPIDVSSANAFNTGKGNYQQNSGSTGNITFEINFGSDTSTTYLNRNGIGRQYGGIMKSFIEVIELEQ